MPDIITWNVQSGCQDDFFPDFLSMAAEPNVAVICLQEVNHAFDEYDEKPPTPLLVHPKDPGSRGTKGMRTRLFEELTGALNGTYQGYFAPQLRGYLHDREASLYDVGFGQAMFIRHGIEHGPVAWYWAYGDGFQPNEEGRLHDQNGIIVGKKSSKVIQVARVVLEGAPLLLGNVHGFWSMAGKVDCPERFVQNQQIANAFLMYRTEYCAGEDLPLMLVGDLNYTSKMQALYDLAARLTRNGVPGINLNHVWGINDTRTIFYDKGVREADFVITCPDAAQLVSKLVFLHDVASDHARGQVMMGVRNGS